MAADQEGFTFAQDRQGKSLIPNSFHWEIHSINLYFSFLPQSEDQPLISSALISRPRLLPTWLTNGTQDSQEIRICNLLKRENTEKEREKGNYHSLTSDASAGRTWKIAELRFDSLPLLTGSNERTNFSPLGSPRFQLCPFSRSALQAITTPREVKLSMVPHLATAELQPALKAHIQLS